MGAVLLAAQAGFFCPEVRAESGPSMFAPAAKDQAAEKKSAAGKKKGASGSQAVQTEGVPVPGGGSPYLTTDEGGGKTLVIRGEPEVNVPTIVVDDRGNKTIVISGGGEPEPSPIVVDELGNKTIVIKGEDLPPAASSPITVDEYGRKSIVLKGDSGPESSSVTVDEYGRKSIVLKGDSGPESSSVTVDEYGRKTIVIKGGEELPPAALTVGDPPAAAPPAESGVSPWHTAPSAAADAEPVDRPYWVTDKAADEQPYFRVAPSADTTPYWVKKEESSEVPYWKMDNSEDNGPYWAPKKKSDQPAAPAAKTVSSGFAPQTNSPAPAAKTREISVYARVDERGVVHITNVPADPRFRLFTITVVVDVKMQRGLAGTRRRFNQESLRPYIMKAAATYNLDPALIAAIIKSESAFDANAVSWAGAQGLMQLMPKTAREVGCHDPFDPESNIMGGSRYIRWMLDRFNGNLDLAIAAYNCGPTRVAREGKIPNIAETRNYVVIVKRNYLRYQGEF